jgi:hypothetical protein
VFTESRDEKAVKKNARTFNEMRYTTQKEETQRNCYLNLFKSVLQNAFLCWSYIIAYIRNTSHKKDVKLLEVKVNEVTSLQ